MAEMLAYAPDLRSITQGQGDYTLELLRYDAGPGRTWPSGARAPRGRAGCAHVGAAARSDGSVQ